MKKITLILTIFITVTTTGCSSINNKEKDETYENIEGIIVEETDSEHINESSFSDLDDISKVKQIVKKHFKYPEVSDIEIEGESKPIFVIEADLKISATDNLTDVGMYADCANFLEEVKNNNIEASRYMFKFYVTMVDIYGNTETQIYKNLSIKNEDLMRINFDNFISENLKHIFYSYELKPSASQIEKREQYVKNFK